MFKGSRVQGFKSSRVQKLASLTFVATQPFKSKLLWRSLLQKFKCSRVATLKIKAKIIYKIKVKIFVSILRNRVSNESHNARINGRVAFEDDKVNEVTTRLIIVNCQLSIVHLIYLC